MRAPAPSASPLPARLLLALAACAPPAGGGARPGAAGGPGRGRWSATSWPPSGPRPPGSRRPSGPPGWRRWPARYPGVPGSRRGCSTRRPGPGAPPATGRAPPRPSAGCWSSTRSTPTPPQAKYELALLDLELGRARDGLATLASLYPQLPEAEPAGGGARRGRGRRGGARSGPRRSAGGASWRPSATGAERAEALARADDVVDARLSFARAWPGCARRCRPTSPAQPAVAMKLDPHPAPPARLRRAPSRRPASPHAPPGPARPGAPTPALVLERLGRLTAVQAQRHRRGGAALRPVQALGRGDPAGRSALALGEGSGVKLVIRDTRGEPDGAAAAIEQLALDEGAIAVVGGVTNAEAERAAATAEELAVPFISLSKQEDVTDAGPHVFQNMLTAGAQARALADLFMGQRGMSRFAIMYPSVALRHRAGQRLLGRGRGPRRRGARRRDLPHRPDHLHAAGEGHGGQALPRGADRVRRGGARRSPQKETDPFRRRKALEKAARRPRPGHRLRRHPGGRLRPQREADRPGAGGRGRASPSPACPTS